MENLVKLLIAALFGGLVGMEREIRGQYAGFRTQLLVCLGSCLFTIVSVTVFETYGKNADPGRIAAQIIAGIGFLGAGAILRHGNYIRGLTTAASLWIISAIGMAVGFGDYMLAGVTTLLVIGSLISLKNMESILTKDNYAALIIKTSGPEEVRFEELLKGLDIKIIESKFRFIKGENTIEQNITLMYRNHERFLQFCQTLKGLPDLIELHIS